MKPAQGFVQIIIAVVIALVVGAGAMFAYQKYAQKPAPSPSPTSSSTNTQAQTTNKNSPLPTASDETANWKTYSNAALRYSIKYPDNLKVVIPKLEGSPPNKEAVLSDMPITLSNGMPDDTNTLYKKLGGIGGSDGLIIFKGFVLWINTTGLDSSSEVIDNIRQANNKSEQMMIDGVKGYKRSTKYDGGGYQNTKIWIDIVNGKRVYSITAQFLSSKKEYLILFDQVLSTFKFTQ